MIPSGPTAASMPVRPGTDLQQGPQAQPAPSGTSATTGDDRSAVKAETAQVVDPARQSADTLALPQNETNEEARLVEPSRLSSETLAQQAVTPDVSTPAGPPPTFDWSVLEKARALAAEGPTPEPGQRSEPARNATPQTKASSEGADLPGADRAAVEGLQLRATTTPETEQVPQAAKPGASEAPTPAADTAPATASAPGQTGSVPPGVEA